MILTGTHLEMQNWDRTGDRAGLSAGRSIPPVLFLCPSLSVSHPVSRFFRSVSLPVSLFLSVSPSLFVFLSSCSLWLCPCLPLSLVPLLSLSLSLFPSLSSLLPSILPPSHKHFPWCLLSHVLYLVNSERDRGARSTPCPSKAHNLVGKRKRETPRTSGKKAQGHSAGSTPSSYLDWPLFPQLPPASQPPDSSFYPES